MVGRVMRRPDEAPAYNPPAEQWPQRLSAYLGGVLPGFSGQPLSLAPLSGGRSNPTFSLTSGAHRYVLRCRPPDKPDRAAHRIDREYQVQSALCRTNVPVAKMYHLCEDESIIGTSFYIMEFVEGLVLEDPKLAGLSPGQRRSACLDAVAVLARLHRLDWTEEPGLVSFGRLGGFLRRQTEQFGRQLDDRPEISNPALAALRRAVEQSLPHDDRTVLVHGDFRTGNLVIDPSGKVRAVLDWELSTLGNPFADLAYFLIPYDLPHDNALLPGMKGIDPAVWELPSEADLIRDYLRLTGFAGIPEWNAYKAFALYRFTVITGGALLRRAQAESRSLDDGEHAVLDQFAKTGLAAMSGQPEHIND